MARQLFCFVLAATFFATTELRAQQCINTITPSCDVYASCFSYYCRCSGDDEYFISYGKQYCEKFLGTQVTGAAKIWRDRTLKCLQERIVPHLPRTNKDPCNCRAMRDYAFKSHVECYTQPDASICDLAYKDLLDVGFTVKLSDMVNTSGRETICGIARSCARQRQSVSGASDKKRNVLWATLNDVCQVTP